MKTKRQAITVVLGDDTTYVVEAYVCGALAIHRAVLHNPEDGYHLSRHSWSITHVPTGLCVIWGDRLTYSQARRILAELLTYADWNQPVTILLNDADLGHKIAALRRTVRTYSR